MGILGTVGGAIASYFGGGGGYTGAASSAASLASSYANDGGGGGGGGGSPPPLSRSDTRDESPPALSSSNRSSSGGQGFPWGAAIGAGGAILGSAIQARGVTNAAGIERGSTVLLIKAAAETLEKQLAALERSYRLDFVEKERTDRMGIAREKFMFDEGERRKEQAAGLQRYKIDRSRERRVPFREGLSRITGKMMGASAGGEMRTNLRRADAAPIPEYQRGQYMDLGPDMEFKDLMNRLADMQLPEGMTFAELLNRPISSFVERNAAPAAPVAPANLSSTDQYYATGN